MSQRPGHNKPDDDDVDFDEKLARLMSKLPDRSLSVLTHALKTHRSVDQAFKALQPPRKHKAPEQTQLHVASTSKRTLDSWVTSPANTRKRKGSGSKVERDDSHKVISLISDEEEDKDPQPPTAARQVSSSSSPAQSRPHPKELHPSRNDGPQKPNAFDVLRPQRQEGAPPKDPGPPPLLLGTPELVAEHTPCTLLLNALPPELALACYIELLEESTQWHKNRWNIFEREVLSPHTTRFYYDQTEPHLSNAGSYWYNSNKEGSSAKPFTPAMDRVRRLIEPLVNERLSLRRRLPHEWAGPWKANVAAANCYAGSQQSVGFHSDRLNYLGPQTTICSVSLGVTRLFRLRSQGDEARTLDLALPHNSLLIMHAGCQEAFKHSVPPQRTIDLFTPKISAETAHRLHKALKPNGRTGFTERINMTFRFYRPDFTPEAANDSYPSLPRCRCEGRPLCVLRPDMKGKLSPDASTPYFWQCGGSGTSCGFFQVLDMTGRGPCIGQA